MNIIDPGITAKDPIALKEYIDNNLLLNPSISYINNDFTNLLIPNAIRFVHPLLILHGDGDILSEYMDVEDFFNQAKR